MGKVKWKLAKGKSWRQKLEQVHPNHGKSVPIPPAMQKRCGTGMMLIPRPMDVDAIMKAVKKGHVITSSQIRSKLARQAGADCACPLTTGIFIRVAAEAAEEDRLGGKKRITPYWRTIHDDGSLYDGFPGGAAAQAKRLRAEGIAIGPGKRKKPPIVKELDRRLTKA